MKHILFLFLLIFNFSPSKGYINDNIVQTDSLDIYPSHRLEFNDCSMMYNGKPFKLDQPIDEFVKVFGPYDRMIERGRSIYIWDKLGISAILEKKKETVMLLYVSLSKSWVGINQDKESLEGHSKDFFKVKLLLEGIPLEFKKTKINDFIMKSKGKWEEAHIPLAYYSDVKNCDPQIVYSLFVSNAGYVDELSIYRKNVDF